MHDAFVEQLVARVRGLRLGSGLEDGTTQGPLITSAAVDRVRSCLECGCGGEVTGDWGVPRSPSQQRMLVPAALPQPTPHCLPQHEAPVDRTGASACRLLTAIPPSATSTLPLQVEDKVQDALDRGAVAACGGRRAAWEVGSPLAGGYFYEPTVLTGESRAVFL